MFSGGLRFAVLSQRFSCLLRELQKRFVGAIRFVDQDLESFPLELILAAGLCLAMAGARVDFKSRFLVCFFSSFCFPAFKDTGKDMKKIDLGSLLCLAMCVVSGTVYGQTITWSSAGIASVGEAGISTDGTLEYAFNSAGGEVTANGVTFAATTPGTGVATLGSGQITIAFPDNGANANFSNQSRDFGELLDSAFWAQRNPGDPNDRTVISLNGLTEGRNYLVQILSSDTRGSRNSFVAIDRDLPTEFIDTIGNGTGGGGIFLNGTFTADADGTTSFTYIHDGLGGNANFNAIQVREIGDIPEPPEPPSGVLNAANRQVFTEQGAPFGDVTLTLQLYNDPSGSDDRLNSTANQSHTATGNPNLFVVSQTGVVYEVTDPSTNGGPNSNSSVFFDYGQAIQDRGGNLDGLLLAGSGGQLGLQGIAFHPEFAANGRFYSTAVVSSGDRSNFEYLGSSTSPGNVDIEGVIAEWTVGSNGQVDPDSYRELFRVQLPEEDHLLKLPQFDPHAVPGDENYGLLFISHGDGDSQNQGGVTVGQAQDLTNAVGKFLRVDPLEDPATGAPYTIPPSNPFVNDPNALDEIYTSGHRNPHTFSFADNPDGNSHILVGEISFENIEEINLLQAGGDYGWSERQGTFITNRNDDREFGIDGGPTFGTNSSDPGDGGNRGGDRNDPSSDGGLFEITSSTPIDDYIYPVAQYDHQFQGSGQAVAGGFVIDNGSELDGEYIFGDFSLSTGAFYSASLDDLLAANTERANGELTTAALQRLRLEIDLDGDGDIDRSGDHLQALIFGDSTPGRRTDLRFGQGVNGELYVTTKQDGNVYLVMNTLAVAAPALTGDFEPDGDVDTDDIDFYSGNIGEAADGALAQLDFDVNGLVTLDDHQFHIENLVQVFGEQIGTFVGDVNLDGSVDVLGDAFVLVANLNTVFGASYADGDLNADGVVSVLGDAFVLISNLGRTNQE